MVAHIHATSNQRLGWQARQVMAQRTSCSLASGKVSLCAQTPPSEPTMAAELSWPPLGRGTIR